MRKFSFVLAVAAFAVALAVPANASEIKNTNSYEFVTPMGDYDFHEIVAIDQGSDKGSSITITNPNKPDSTAPTIKSVKLDKSKYVIGTDNYMKVTIKATDNLSGIGHGYIYYTNSKTKDTISVHFSETDYDKKKKVYVDDAYISPIASGGTYKFDYATVKDNAGNEKIYLSTDKKTPSFLKKSKFTLVQKPCKINPTLKSIDIKTPVLTYVFKSDWDEKQRTVVTAKATSKGENIETIIVYFRKDFSSDSFATEGATLFKTVDKKTGEVYYEGEYVAASDYSIGTWYVYAVDFYNASGGFVEINYDNKKLPTSYKKKKITVKAQAGADLTQPKATAFSFVKNKLTMSKKKDSVLVDLNVTVADANSGVKHVYVRICDTKTGRYFYKSVSLTTPVKKGKIKLTLEIPKNCASGTFKLDEVTIEDASNNYTNYVPSATKKKLYKNDKTYKAFPSFMSKAKLVVKNTYKKK